MEDIIPLFTIFSVAVTFFVIYKEYVRPSLGLLLLVLVYLLLKIISPSDLLNGLSNPSIVSIVLLILITAGIRKNFNLERWLDRFFFNTTSYISFLFRMMTSVGLLSSIVNNTPVVALLTPYVVNWGKKNDIAPSRLLIPLSYATILGGMITIIGTSTTLVLNGFLQETLQMNLNSLDLIILGGSVFVVGIAFILLIGHQLLPSKVDSLEDLKVNPKEYLVEAKVDKNSPLIGKTIRQAGLRKLRDAYIVELIRDKEAMAPVSPEEIIQEGDSLLFAGDTNRLVELINSGIGLSYPKQVLKIYQGNIEIVEAVMNNSSSLIGRKVRETDFRNRYNAAIVAVNRNGEKLGGKIGDMVLRPGDLLLLFAGEDYSNRVDLYRDVYTISKLREIGNPSRTKVLSTLLIAALSVALLILGYFSLFTSLVIIFSAMAGFRLVTIQDIKRDLDFNLIGTLVFSLVVGQAIISTGTGDLIAHHVLGVFEPYGNKAILAGILLLTTILSTFVTNVGAVSIAFPVVYSLVSTADLPGMPFYLAVAYAASAAFITPVSYQTNLIIYGPGSYKFRDFAKIGVPVAFLYLVVVFLGINWLYHI